MHKIELNSDVTRIYKSEEGHDVEVELIYALDDELICRLDREADADVRGSLRIVVCFDRTLRMSEEHMLCIAELASLSYFLDVRQGNGFKLVSRSVPIVDVAVCSSRVLVTEALNQESILRDLLMKEHAGHLLKEFDLLSAYGCGLDARVVPQGDLHCASSSAKRIKVPVGRVMHDLEVDTVIGSVKLTQRSIQECLHLPLNMELKVIDPNRFVRPFEMVRRLVSDASMEMESSHQHLKNLRNKFGEGARTLVNNVGVYSLIDLVPVNEKGKYLVIGFRQLYSRDVQKRLKAKGYFKE